MNMLAQIDGFTLPGDPKTWLMAIAGVLITMIVGRFIQAFRSGAGLKGAAAAVWLGTNIPKPPVTIILFALMLSICGANAQTTTNTPLSNPFFSALNTIVIDTNSTFFAIEKFSLRSALLENNQTAADFGGDYNINSQWQIGGDVVSRGAASVISEAGLDAAYRITIHNMELDPLLGVSWSWDDNTAYLRQGLRLRYWMSGRAFTFIQPELREDVSSLKAAGRPQAQIQIGVGFSF